MARPVWFLRRTSAFFLHSPQLMLTDHRPPQQGGRFKVAAAAQGTSRRQLWSTASAFAPDI